MLKQSDCENQFKDEPECQPMFKNYYQCDRCSHEWSDEWPAMCDDDCPSCGKRHLEPSDSTEIAACSCQYMGATK